MILSNRSWPRSSIKAKLIILQMIQVDRLQTDSVKLSLLQSPFIASNHSHSKILNNMYFTDVNFTNWTQTSSFLLGGGPFIMEATSTLTPSVFKTDLAAFFAAFAIFISSEAVVSADSEHFPHLEWSQFGLVKRACGARWGGGKKRRRSRWREMRSIMSPEEEGMRFKCALTWNRNECSQHPPVSPHGRYCKQNIRMDTSSYCNHTSLEISSDNCFVDRFESMTRSLPPPPYSGQMIQFVIQLNHNLQC